VTPRVGSRGPRWLAIGLAGCARWQAAVWQWSGCRTRWAAATAAAPSCSSCCSSWLRTCSSRRSQMMAASVSAAISASSTPAPCSTSLYTVGQSQASTGGPRQHATRADRWSKAACCGCLKCCCRAGGCCPAERRGVAKTAVPHPHAPSLDAERTCRISATCRRAAGVTRPPCTVSSSSSCRTDWDSTTRSADASEARTHSSSSASERSVQAAGMEGGALGAAAARVTTAAAGRADGRGGGGAGCLLSVSGRGDQARSGCHCSAL
jgi:hypothetical protein